MVREVGMMCRIVFGVISIGVMATPGYGCDKAKSFDLLDFAFADVAIEAKIVGYEVQTNKKSATMTLETVDTLRGFHAARWEAQVRPASSDSLHVHQAGPQIYLIALGGRISSSGKPEVAVVWKACGGPAVLPVDAAPGRSILKELQSWR